MKHALITGASSGIGRQLAFEYASAGWTVFACGRNQQELEAMQSVCSHIHPKVFDVTRSEEVLATAATLPPLDLVILNAGTCEYLNDPVQFDGALFERVIQTNLISVGYCLQAYLPKVPAGGRVAFVSSSAAWLPLSRAEAYGASKAGMTYLAQTLSIDLASQNIGVSTIHPGFVETPLTDKNDFPMPCRISVEEAGRVIHEALDKGKQDIHFPGRFTRVLKSFSLLPFAVWRRIAMRMVRHEQ